jgi:hypothetical protein
MEMAFRDKTICRTEPLPLWSDGPIQLLCITVLADKRVNMARCLVQACLLVLCPWIIKVWILPLDIEAFRGRRSNLFSHIAPQQQDVATVTHRTSTRRTPIFNPSDA